MMDRDLFLSILAMDSYNRGYDVGIEGLSTSSQIGNALILSDALAELDNEDVVGAGFYAIAYDMTGVAGFSAGETVISYRGTDNPSLFGTNSDIWNGWTLGGGFAAASQGNLALQFYEAVAGREATAGANSDVITTGHSLGGGLAGFVGALSGGEAVVFDHMPFLIATVAQVVRCGGRVLPPDFFSAGFEVRARMHRAAANDDSGQRRAA